MSEEPVRTSEPPSQPAAATESENPKGNRNDVVVKIGLVGDAQVTIFLYLFLRNNFLRLNLGW
jgi:hypothetical protein